MDNSQNNHNNMTIKKKNKKTQLSTMSVVLISLLSVMFVAVALIGGFLVFYSPDPSDPGFETIPVPIYVTDEDGNTVEDTRSINPHESDVDPKTQMNGVYNFLVVGHDKVALNTDVMMIISYDIAHNRISIVQVPRDTYFHTDGMNICKINAAYGVFYKNAVKAEIDDPDTAALTSLAAMIQKHFCIKLNYAAIIDLDGFVNIIDIIGGVYIDVPSDMKYSDPLQDLYIDIKAGEQWLDGKTAMQFVRYRKGYVEQDIGRQDAMKIFMSAVLRQVKDNFSASMVLNIAGEVIKNMKTTISLADFIYFGKSALSIDLSQVYMTTLPGDSTMVDGASVYVLYRDDTIKVINDYLNVYDHEITTDDFDPDGAMTSDKEKVIDIYTKPLGTSKNKVYTASDVNENSIKIPRSKSKK